MKDYKHRIEELELKAIKLKARKNTAAVSLFVILVAVFMIIFLGKG